MSKEKDDKTGKFKRLSKTKKKKIKKQK